MPRTAITKQAILGPYPTMPVAANSLDITLAACDVANGNQVVPSGDDVLVVLNSDPTNPYTFTLASVADDKGRTGDITTYSLSAGEYAFFRLKKTGWMQSDGNIYINGSNAAIKFAVLTL